MTDRFPYEKESTWTSSLEQKKLWHEELERTGLTAVKFILAQNPHGSASSIAVGREISMTKGFAEEWVAWHEAQQTASEASFRAFQTRWTQIAAWAGIAAAVVSAVGIVVQFYFAK